MAFRLSGLHQVLVLSGVLAMMFIVACGSAAPETVEVIKEVPVEREVIREVEVEVPVDREVIREVEVEKTVVETEIKEVQVDKILVATPTPAPAPEAAAQSEGHLRITYTSMGSDGIYPKASNVNAGGKDLNSSMYDVVIGSNAQGAFSKETGLANDWSVSPDGKVHTIRLRQGIQFHNGTEVTSEDVLFSALEVMEEDAQNAFINELTPAVGQLRDSRCLHVGNQLPHPVPVRPLDILRRARDRGHDCSQGPLRGYR